MAMTAQQRQQILAEVVNTFGKQEWFRDAVVYNEYPATGQPTLEIKVNYVPLFEMKHVKNFVMKHNLVDVITVVDRDGNPVG